MRWSLLVGCFCVASVAAAQDAALHVGSRIRVRTGPVVAVPGVVEMRGARTHAMRPVRLITKHGVTLVLASNEPLTVARPGVRIVGAIARTDRERVVLLLSAGEELAVPRGSIQQVDVLVRERTRPERAKRGFLDGAATGAIVAALLGSQCEGDCPSTSRLALLVGGMSGGVGALLQAFSTSAEVWRPVDLTALP